MFQRYSRLSLMAIGLVSALHATPVYYSFTGTVVGNSGIAGYTVGQDFSMMVKVDRDRPGYRNYNGNTYFGDDLPDHDVFQVDYVAGDLAATDAVAFTPRDEHTGFSDKAGYLELTVSNLDLSGNDYFTLQDWSHTLDGWKIGQGGISGTHVMWDAEIWWYQVASMNLTVTDISNANPIASEMPEAAPEPSGLALFGLGAIGLALAALARRKA